MKASETYLARDLKALRYFDALHAADLVTMSALWEEASHDPELERILAELDGATFQEMLGNSGVRPEQLGRQRRRLALWGYAVGTVAAACLLAIFAWPRYDTKESVPDPRSSQSEKEVAHKPLGVSHDLTPLLSARRDLDESAMPRFVWPQENLLSASTPLDLLD